jgi:hypothetical protein
MAEKKDNSGILFKNDRKEQPKHPDSKGSCTIGGNEYWISGWTKEGEKGKYVSLSFEPKQPKAETSSEAPVKAEDIPF